MHLVDLGGERRAAKLDIAGGQGPHVDGRRRLQLAKGLLGGNKLSQIHVEVLGGGGGAHRQRGGVGDAHVRREALRDRIGQLGAAHDLLHGVDQLQVSEVLETSQLGIGHAQAKERGFGHIRHERSPTRTFSACRVGQIPQPVQDVRVQSGVVTPSSERRYSRSRNPRDTPGLTCSQGRRQSSS